MGLQMVKKWKKNLFERELWLYFLLTVKNKAYYDIFIITIHTS